MWLLWLQDLSCNQLLPPPARHHPIRLSTRLCARKNGVLWLQVSYCAKDLEAARKVPMHVGMPTHHPVICALQGLLRQVQLGLLRHHPRWCSSATGCRSVQVYPLHNCSGERDADAGAMLAAWLSSEHRDVYNLPSGFIYAAQLLLSLCYATPGTASQPAAPCLGGLCRRSSA